MTSPYAPGRRWRCAPQPDSGRCVFWFVIIGPGENYVGKPSSRHKRCRLEVSEEDRARRAPGYHAHGREESYTHAHLRRWAVLEPEQ